MASPAPQAPMVNLNMVLDQVAKDKGIERSVLVDTLQNAITQAAKKHFGQDRAIEATYNEDKQVVEVFQTLTVVERVEVEDPIKAVNQISLDEAGKKGIEAEVGDELLFQIFYRPEDEEEARQSFLNVGTREVEEMVVVPQGRRSLSLVAGFREKAGIKQGITVVVALARRDHEIRKACNVVRKAVGVGWVVAAMEVGRGMRHPEPDVIGRQVVSHADDHALADGVRDVHLERRTERERPRRVRYVRPVVPDDGVGQLGVEADAVLLLDEFEEVCL